MSTCFLKRFVPFLLTLVVGIGLGSIFQTGRRPAEFQARTVLVGSPESRSRYRTEYRSQLVVRSSHDESIPLAIIYEPPTRMTAAALRHETSGIVQLLVEYGADGHARVLERTETLPDGLTEEAVRVAEQTQFRPEWVNGEPVTVTRVQSYYFHAGQD